MDKPPVHLSHTEEFAEAEAVIKGYQGLVTLKLFAKGIGEEVHFRE